MKILTWDIVSHCTESFLNSSPPSAAYMHWWTGSSLLQVTACRLFGAKPLPKPMSAYCQLDSLEQFSVKFESEFCHFHSRKFIRECPLPKWQPFCPGWVELNNKAIWRAMIYLKFLLMSPKTKEKTWVLNLRMLCNSLKSGCHPHHPILMMDVAMIFHSVLENHYDFPTPNMFPVILNLVILIFLGKKM